MRIKEISQANRPRERFSRLGGDALSDAELLALILQMGTHGENVIDMSNRLISKYPLDKLSSLSLTELQEIKGIGPAKAMQIKAVFELNKRCCRKEGLHIRTAKDVFEYASPKLCDKDKEHFMIILLDSKNKVIKDEIVSIGTVSSALAHPREIFKSAIRESASSVVLVHNHPSGDPSPSEADEVITERLVNAGDMLGIEVLDHVILGNGNLWSWKEN